MGRLLEDAHDKLELVLVDESRLRVVGLLALALCATRGIAAGDGTLSARPFAARFLVVAVEPLLVALVKAVGKAIDDGIIDSLFNSDRGGKLGDGVLPLVRWVKLLVIADEASVVGDWNKNLGSGSATAPSVTRAGGIEDGL